MSNQETEILSMLSSAYPQLDAGPGTPFYELVVRPMAFLWSSHEAGQTELLSASVLSNYASMDSDDLDRLMSRFFATRKTGEYVYATVRLIFDTVNDYYIAADTGVTASNSRTYTVVGDYYISQHDLPGDVINGYYVDVSIVSTGMGNFYNTIMNDAVSISSTTITTALRKAYVLQDGSDGGIIENNTDFYNRVKSSMSLQNFTTYRSVKSLIQAKFNVKEVVPIGIRDSELRRDLVELPGVGIVHRGGMSDFYVRCEPYSIVSGYQAPLGFPYTFAGTSIETDPSGLMVLWNSRNIGGSTDITLRGSVKESIDGLTALTNMFSLVSTVQPIHDYVTSTDYETLHTDNLVKQMWPIMVVAKISISDSAGSSAISIVQSAFTKYIMGLSGSAYPTVTNAVHAILNAGIEKVHLPIELDGYYLTENCVMQKIGINNSRIPTTSLLDPIEVDSLRFTVGEVSQISIRTCVFYTNNNLVTVEVI